MGLRDKASKVLDALKQRDGRAAAGALTDAIDTARVRLMDEVVSRLSGHPVHTDGSTVRQEDLSPPSEAPAPPTPPPEPARPPEKARAAPPAPAPAPPAAAEAPPPAPEGETLPDGYRRDRLILLVRDPTWAFAHWDFSSERLAAAAEGLTDPRALLRFYEVGTETPLIDADVSPENGRYYLRVPRPGRRYEARLVLVGANGAQREVARSNDAEPPAQAARDHQRAPRFVRMDAQTAVLDRLDEVLVPPPRLVMDVANTEVEAPPFAPRNPRWAAVIAGVRGRRLAEQAATLGALGTSPSGAQAPSVEPPPGAHLAEAFEAAPSSSEWVRPEPRRWPPAAS